MKLTGPQTKALKMVVAAGEQGVPEFIGGRKTITNITARNLRHAGLIACKDGETRWTSWPLVATDAGRVALDT